MIAWRISGPKTFNGSIEVPGDKSIAHRAVMIGALAEGSTHITNFLPSDDCQRTLAAFRQLGIEATQHSLTEITVFGGQLSEPNN
ncbi:MAG: 3-phosphoshikimate 1-carboxyvinyltransferase, partial [Armatimonadota bacterium]